MLIHVNRAPGGCTPKRSTLALSWQSIEREHSLPHFRESKNQDNFRIDKCNKLQVL